ncbi:MAG TPA: hypothetical protein PLM53_03320 [Spirochaetota bacterium]|nr:hypothetical protein [Spirochaetota bacterium]HPC40321.1 hypothetical protein [Spirochaetota bacterium]HPL18264.1 hypothetical protein [Spirochaetota bacterium]HQF07205.1 hypothetical protein [Spirochaetota bacterium]HQH96105.1 hypothetical protein [Spirochaetota bacterium]
MKKEKTKNEVPFRLKFFPPNGNDRTRNNNAGNGMKKASYRFQFLYRPGLHLDDGKLRRIIDEMRRVAASCFEEIPEYQAMTGCRKELTDTVIAVAWRSDGTMAGFCSTVILPVTGVGDVQHLGLTCVRPEDRSNGLTHILTHKAVAGYLVRHKPVVGKLWVSNCAAVLSSLVNVSLHFEQVYPSPFGATRLTEKHRKIAEAIDRHYRHKIYIHRDATFDTDAFVFRGSVKGTMFQKDSGETCYYHRNRDLNEFYKDRMVFENGDEVLQVGYATTLAAVRHMLRNMPLPKPGMKSKNEKRMPAA